MGLSCALSSLARSFLTCRAHIPGLICVSVHLNAGSSLTVEGQSSKIGNMDPH